ncbi:MAG TPA: hypothetical protein VNZ22_18860 [Bacillota bacterium]|nr:hypothetical protein [Bacillota bacterium]
MTLYKQLTEAEKAAIGEADTIAFGLKPCPHANCGSRRLYVGREQQSAYAVECLDCGRRSIVGQTIEEAVEHWGQHKIDRLLSRPSGRRQYPWNPATAVRLTGVRTELADQI